MLVSRHLEKISVTLRVDNALRTLQNTDIPNFYSHMIDPSRIYNRSHTYMDHQALTQFTTKRAYSEAGRRGEER